MIIVNAEEYKQLTRIINTVMPELNQVKITTNWEGGDRELFDRRLSETMVCDYIALTLDLDHLDSFDVRIIPVLDGNLAAEAEAARQAVRDAEQAQRKAAGQSRDIVKRLKAAGLSGADIAVVLKISTQRVSQLANP